ncbi:MAG: AMP-binding protein [Nitrososphaerales archaeon]
MPELFTPSRETIENANVTQFMDSQGINSYKDLVKRSGEDISWWWKLCEETLSLEWTSSYSKVYDSSKGIENTKWFLGAKLNAIDTVLKNSTKNALIWEGEDGRKKTLSYLELRREVSKFQNYLDSIGVAKGDVVASILPMLPETIVAMLGAIKAGAVFSPIFCGYGPQAIASRIANSNPKLVITCDGYYRKGSKILLKNSVDEALQNVNSSVLVVERLGGETPMKQGRDHFYSEINESANSKSVEMEPDDPALLLYTSGTTGKPKGAVISHAGVLLQPAKEAFFNLDVKQEDVFMWITDIGWMMGPWQVFGSQTLGATHVIFEGVPDYPSKDRIYKMIEEYKITHLGHSATTMRMIRKHGNEIIKEHDLSSLRILGNTGEPIDQDTWNWEMENIGNFKTPFINLSGGTEIFGCFLLPSPVVTLKPSTLWGPGLGMDVDVYDDAGKSIRGEIGYLVCKKPFPSMTRGFWNDHDRYLETYWAKYPGTWYHGDWALVDKDGFWFLLGRADDVIKVAGRRVGPAEIESILNSHPSILESACVGLYDEVKGEKLYCFVSLKPNAKKGEETSSSAKKLVSQNLGKTLEPDKIIFVEDLPRTRSGKIIRRLIRSVVSNEPLGETSTMENPESLEKIKRAYEEQK